MRETLTVDVLKAIVDERDIRYQQRWQAQESALASALAAAEKAVAAALISQEKAVTNAFLAQEKSVSSALNAAERSGKSSGLNDGWIYLIGLVSVIGVVATFFSMFKK